MYNVITCNKIHTKRLNSNRSNPKAFNRLSYHKLHIPVNLFVKLRWTDSRGLMLLTRHRVSTSMYSLTFRVRVTTPPAARTKWNGVVADNVAHAVGASSLSLVRGVFAGMRSACGVRWSWPLPRISSVAIATQPVHRLQIRPTVHNYGNIPYHSPKLHAGPCNSIGM